MSRIGCLSIIVVLVIVYVIAYVAGCGFAHGRAALYGRAPVVDFYSARMQMPSRPAADSARIVSIDATD
jgi:hypothetical protein